MIFSRPFNRLTIALTASSILSVVFAVCSQASTAPIITHNVYRIDDECYDLFIEAQSKRKDPESLSLGDKMRRLAVEKDDQKARTLSYTLPVRYYYTQPDKQEEFFSACRDLMTAASESGYSQYYYFTYSEMISYLLDMGDTSRALEVAMQMNADALKNSDTYGLMSCANATGNIYMARGDIQRARRSYEKARKYSYEIPGQTVSGVIVSLSQTYSDADSALAILGEAYDRMKTPSDTILLYKEIAFAKARKNDKEGFEMARQLFLSYYDKYKTQGTADDFAKMSYYESLFSGDYKQAESDAMEIEDMSTRYSLLEHAAIAKGDYKTAYESRINISRYKDSLALSTMNSGFDEIEALFENDRLTAANDAIRIQSEKAITRHKNSLNYVVFGSIFIVLFILVDFFIFYLNEKNRSIRSQKKLSESLMASMDEASKAKDEAIRMKEAALLAKEQADLSKEEALKAKEEAEKANNMKTTFVQNMSHEIRTPLNAIVGFSQLMSLPDGFLSEDEKSQYAKYILNNSNLLTMLIDDILNINDVESGNYKINIEDALCNDICRQAMNSVEYRVPPGVDYLYTTEIEEDFSILTDERRVRQVLINFLTNACKHTVEGAIRVHSRLVEDGATIEFSVSDTGSGVPVEMKEKIFERFTKLDSFKQGAGLGLHICRIIAEKLGGSITLDTDYIEGARFVFCIPAKIKKDGFLTCEPIN